MKMVVRTTETCPKCHALMRTLDKKNIQYEQIDLTRSEAEMNDIKAHGFSSAPVVTFDDGVTLDGNSIVEILGRVRKMA